jgi:flagellar motor switch protein FliN/FliY
LSARLTDLPVTLGDLVALQLGDVLLSSHRLVEPLWVWASHPATAVAASQPICAARLAQRDGHIAIQLTDLPTRALASGALTPPSLEGSHMRSPSVPTPSAHDATGAQWLELPAAIEPTAASASLSLASNPLLGVKTTLRACVGSAVITIGELSSAHVGQVITLDREVDAVIDLLLDGQVVARGQLVAVDDYFGVRLTELPLPLTPNGAAIA